MLQIVEPVCRPVEHAGPCYGFFMRMLLWGMRNARCEDERRVH